MANWAKDLSDSNFDFMRLVWDKIKDYCGGGVITPVEIIQDNDIARQLDILAGIDIWQAVSNYGVRGIASRVQWISKLFKPYNTFTIRYIRDSGAETEFVKRSRAIKNGDCIYPYYTCQAYISEPHKTGEFLSCAVAKTTDIFDAIEKYPTQINRTSNASFKYVFWHQVKDVFIFTPPVTKRNPDLIMADLGF